MNRKLSLGVCISLIIISITATFAITMVISKQLYNTIISNLSQRSQTYSVISEISDKVATYYYWGTENKGSQINAGLVEGYIDGLGDPNSYYLNAEEYETYNAVLEGRINGIGVETVFDRSIPALKIAEVYVGSPAETVGLKADDILVEIDKTLVTVENYMALTQKLYGQKLESVSLVYKRDGVEHSVEPMLGFAEQYVSYKLVEDVGYIYIKAFYKTTPDQFRKAIDTLTEQGAQSFVFDVRNTSEGAIEYAAQVIDIVVPSTKSSTSLAVAYDKTGQVYKDKKFSAESSALNKPCAVIVNSRTAGCAELFACDLHDIILAPLVGTKTKGAGTIHEAIALDDGGAVVLTVAAIVPYNEANRFDTEGIEPTYTVEFTGDYYIDVNTVSAQTDPQFSKAYELV